jgi:hypothetical protein
MIVFIYIVLGIILMVLIALVTALNSFDMNVKDLFQQSEKGDLKVYHPEQLSALPMPVQDYFRYVLKDGQPYINQVRLKHNGRFKTSLEAKWKSIEGEEYFTVNQPGFIWKGKMGNFTAIDRFIDGQGSLQVYLFSIFRIANGKGSKFSQGELLRWLGECTWFPTALLPNDYLHWEPMNEHQAKLVFTYKKLLVSYIVTFNDTHEIIQLETSRYMGDNNLETWIGKLSNYRTFNNVVIPATIQAIWKLEHQDFIYAVFYVNQIEYNIPEKFK